MLGLVSAMDEVFALSRRNYRPLREELALDFGLSVMFATPQGDLLGRRWFDQLRKHDRRINGLARGLQRQGIGPARSPDATVPGSRPSGAFSPPRSAGC